MKSEFEKAYSPNPHKSPFTEVRFNDEKQIYEPLNPPLDHVARSLNAAWYGYRIRQTEVDELKLQVAEMKSRLNDAYTDGQSAMYVARQSKVDELQCEVKRINLWYSNVKLQLENKEIDSAIDAKKIDELQKQLIDQGQRFNEQVQHVKDLEHKNAELQKRVDAALKLIESWNKTEFDKTTHWTEGYEEGCYHCAAQLEQALKGGFDHE